MRILFLTVLLIFMNGCFDNRSSDFRSSKRIEAEDGVRKKTEVEMSYVKELELVSHGGCGRADITTLFLNFETKAKVTVDEARESLVCCVEQYLLNINTDEKIKRFLHKFPFTDKDIEIAIFSKEWSAKLLPPYIAYVRASEGVVTYYVNDTFHRFVEFYKEPYDESLKKIKAKQESKSSDNNSAHNIPSEGTKLEQAVLVKTVEEICQNNGLKFRGFAGADLDDIKMLFLSFVGYANLNVEEARVLITDCIGQLLKNINENKRVQPFLHDISFTDKNIEFEIKFRKKDYSLVSPPNIAVIYAKNGTINFYNDKYNQVLEESYEEAFKKVKAKQTITPSK